MNDEIETGRNSEIVNIYIYSHPFMMQKNEKQKINSNTGYSTDTS